jgi:predicted Zn-dependent protease
MKKKLLFVLVAATVMGSAAAFDFGKALSGLVPSDAIKVLGIGQKAVESNLEIPEKQEVEIGKGIAANLLGAAPLVRDDALQRYVNRVGLWLALQTDRPGLPWRFGITQDEHVNAFATPGGTILVTLGLYQKMRNESELAGVLAHEIAHVLQRHQLKAIQSALGNEWRTDLASLVAERKGSVQAAVQLKAFTAGTELFARGLDKGDEFEADRMGVVIAARAGYNPYGLVGALQTLDALNARDAAVALMFKTHPTPSDRLDKMALSMEAQLDTYADAAREPARLYQKNQ